MIRSVVKEAQIGRYKSTLWWYKTADGVWIDNSYFVRVEDLEGNLIEEIDKKRTDIPEVAMPPVRALISAPRNTISKAPVLIDPNNDFWIFTKKPDRPITVWITLDKELGERKIIDVVTGETIGYGTPPPSVEGYSWSGRHYDHEAWIPWRKSADQWFKKWGAETMTKGLATVGEIKSWVQNPNVAYYYAIAHGGPTSALAMDGNIRSSHIKNCMEYREPMWFAFLGHCDAMEYTTLGSFSDAFRKSSLKNTVTIGYYKMGSCGGFGDSVRWQNKLFSLVDEGSSFKDAFDLATALYPRIESGVRFLGDGKIGKEVKKMEMKNVNIWLKKISDKEWTVSVLLKDCDTEAPINAAQVRLDENALITNSEGHVYWDHVPAGNHMLKATRSGYEDTGDPEKPSSVTFTL